jgi:eukaryotic-like serine/threonine-protein kinase
MKPAVCSRCGALISTAETVCAACAAPTQLTSPNPTVTIAANAAAMERVAVAGEVHPNGRTQRREGMIVGERYELVRLLGEGGMGAVWAARHIQTRKRVALKFIRRMADAGPQARRRLIREARAATVIRHPNILAIHDILEVDGAPMLVMDLLEGESLGQHLKRRERLGLAETATILLPVMSAISAAHAAGVVHRDLKPDNIFLVALASGGYDVKVLDFGLAKLTATDGDAATSGGLTRSGEIVGTPQYMAPEQAFGERDIDDRADIWSLGVILYECLSGRRPFPGDNLGQVLKRLVSGNFEPLTLAVPDVPVEVAALVTRMLSLDRACRPKDIDEARQILARYGGTKKSDLALARSPTRGGSRGIYGISFATALVLLAAAVAWRPWSIRSRRRSETSSPIPQREAQSVAADAGIRATAVDPPRASPARPQPDTSTVAPDLRTLQPASSAPKRGRAQRSSAPDVDKRVPLFSE